MEFLRGKSVLITGASGFIGSALARKVKQLGGYVHAIQHIHSVPDGCWDHIHYGNLNNKDWVYELVVSSKPDYVFHLASQAIVGEGERNSHETLTTNIVGSLNLFEALAEYNKVFKLHGVIVASTDKVYGRHDILPYTESHDLRGVMQVHETSKHCEDILAQMAKHTWNLPIGITRFGNVYGPGDKHMSRIVPETIHNLMNGDQPIIRSNGQHYRDFIYIDDVVDGYLALAEHLGTADVVGNFIFNFGTRIPVRILDLVAMISEHFEDINGAVPAPIVQYKAKEEIHKQYVDGKLAELVLGWKPKVKLRDGIAKTVEWYYQENFR